MKTCPMCTAEIPLTATVCQFCDAKFDIVAAGNYSNYYDVVPVVDQNKCVQCGNSGVDIQIASKLIQLPSMLSDQQSEIPAITRQISSRENAALPKSSLGGLNSAVIQVLFYLIALALLVTSCLPKQTTSFYPLPSATLTPSSYNPSPLSIKPSIEAPTETPIQPPDAQVNVEHLNMRTGPGTGYPIIIVLDKGDELDIVGKNPAGDWVEVVTATGKKGWVSSALLNMNITLSGMPISKNIPPSPIPKPTVTSTPIVPRTCPPNPALVHLVSEIDTAISLSFTGPQVFRLRLAPNEIRNLCLQPGTYSYTLSASGYSSKTESDTFNAGKPNCLWVYSGFRIHPLCNAPDNPSTYSPP